MKKCGGHDMAAGLTLASEALDRFTRAFTQHADARLKPDDLIATHRYDTTASLDELSTTLVASLEKLAPFGRDNPPIRLRIEGVSQASRPQLMGQNNKHLQCTLRSSRGVHMRAVAWNWGERIEAVARLHTLSVLATPRINRWNGTSRVELELIDVAEAAN
jgi:single-stranded-DNA-specific exonuclease